MITHNFFRWRLSSVDALHLCNLPRWWFIMHFSILCICLLNQPEWSQFFPDCFQKKFRTISLAIKSIWLFLKQLKTLVQVYLELMFKAYKHYSDQWTNRVVPRAWICEGIRFIHAFTTDVKFILCQWKSWWEQHFLMHKRSCWKCSLGWQLN